MAAMAMAGRDKVTLLTSPTLNSFGLWVEQLLAESTGKEGTGIVPVAGEPLASPTAYGADRFFVALRLTGDRNAALDRSILTLQRAGHPVFRLNLTDRYDLGGEFFRWEFATAVAGHALGIQPFDQPNVQESKDNTGRVLREVEAQGRLPSLPMLTPKQALTQLLEQAAPHRYLAILAYDPDTGKQAWRFYTVPGNPKDGPDNAASDAAFTKVAGSTWFGEYWKMGGGGTVWDSMSYDPGLDLLYIGVGNGSPWNRKLRSEGKGDNLFLSSIVALRPDTGEYVWHYQSTNGESWDHTATQQIIIADLMIDGQKRHVVMQAPKNGFFYVIDAALSLKRG